jgi:two-component system, OmpR family, sensor histidine kinase ChvG
MEANNRRASPPSRLIHSFSLKLFLLALVLLAVPIILYRQFVRAEHQQYDVLRNAAGQTGRVIAAMLRPHLDQFNSKPPEDLRAALDAAAAGHADLKIFMRPASVPADDFTYIASSPRIDARYIRQEQQQLKRLGILARLGPTCDKPTDREISFLNPQGIRELLTSITPLHIGSICWIVVTSQSASVFAPMRADLSFWTSMPMQIAGAIYLLGTTLVIWLFAHMWRNVSRFRRAARRIRLRGTGVTSFRELNSIPELSGVADDFDSLVDALISSQNLIKRTAEETSHAFKAPLAVIAQAIEPLRRLPPPSDIAAKRSLQLIERSVIKLDNLVSAARDLEHAAADLVYPARRQFNLSTFLGQMLEDYDITLASQEKKLSVQVAENVTVYADEDLIEPIVENLLENAASFTVRGATVEVRLDKQGVWAHLIVADRGPGVEPDKLHRIFDRYASFRPTPTGAEEANGANNYQGLGLWIVKRNVDGLNGSISARNRDKGGFEITVRLPAKA